MTIRTYQPGDEAAQVSIYNEAAAELPRFKPATLDEVRRRWKGAPENDPRRFFAVENGVVVGYTVFHDNGRISYPWCRKGHERHAEALFEAALAEMKRRGHASAFAAYRADWAGPCAFFRDHGFAAVREMVNFVMALTDMPTPGARLATSIEPLRPEDLPAVLALGEGVLRARSVAALEQHLFHNPYFPPASVFAIRGRADGQPLAAGVLVSNAAYANPGAVDPAMPCFRLGAFGTEEMQTKRIHGLFSFLARPGRDLHPLGLELLSYAAGLMCDTDGEALAAQVPSDAPHLLRFYQQLFRKQGSFPVFERAL